MAKFAAALLEAHEDDLVFENGKIFGQGRAGQGQDVRRGRGVRLHPGAAARGLEPGLSERGLLRADQQHLPVRLPHRDARDRSRDRRAEAAAGWSPWTTPGHLINPLIVEGQIHGGLAQGIGQAMIEEVGLQRGRSARSPDRSWTTRCRARPTSRASSWTRPSRRRRSTRSAPRACGEAGTLGSTPEHRLRGGGRAERVRREAHRHDAAAREAVAHHPGPCRLGQGGQA